MHFNLNHHSYWRLLFQHLRHKSVSYEKEVISSKWLIAGTLLKEIKVSRNDSSISNWVRGQFSGGTPSKYVTFMNTDKLYALDQQVKYIFSFLLDWLWLHNDSTTKTTWCSTFTYCACLQLTSWWIPIWRIWYSTLNESFMSLSNLRD